MSPEAGGFGHCEENLLAKGAGRGRIGGMRKRQKTLVGILAVAAVAACMAGCNTYYSYVWEMDGFSKSVAKSNGGAGHKWVALTFDDGPYGEATSCVLDILKEKDVKATFFVIGKNALEYPGILQREIAEGHVVGNHTNDHSKTLAMDSPEVVVADVQKAEEAISRVTGLRPRFFRPPYGMESPRMRKTIEGMGYSIVLWTDMTDDYDFHDKPKVMAKNIVRQLEPGAVIDLHDGRDTHIDYPRENLLEALPLIIDEAKKQGFTFVTLDQMLHEDAYFNAESGEVASVAK
jgi:peptidoglycan-N-acetylglucosamine deacetylase